MDAAIECCIHGQSTYAEHRTETWAYSTDYAAALIVAVDNMDSVSITRAKLGSPSAFTVTLDWENEGGYYEGHGAARTCPEAVSRAILDMYSPTEAELADKDGGAIVATLT